MVTRFRYCINGETSYTSIKHNETMKPLEVKSLAERTVKQKYKKLFGVFNLTDIKPVKPKGEKNGTVNKFS